MKKVVFIFSLLVGCHSGDKQHKPIEPNIFIYHLINSEYGYKNVEAIVIKKDSCFYLPPDSLTMSYEDRLPANRSIMDAPYAKELSNLLSIKTIDSLDKSDYIENCAITKNKIGIRYNYQDTSITYYFNEVHDVGRGCKNEILFRILNLFQLMAVNHSSPVGR